MSTPFLTIIGNVASGKSTIMPLIVEALDAHPVYADDLFQTANPFREVYLNDLKRWSLANELWMMEKRAQIMDELNMSKIGKKIAVVDSGLLMSWVYTYSNFLVGNLTLDEWQLYEELFDTLSRGFLSKTSVIFLKCSIPTLLKRLKKRGRDYELKYYTKSYLEQLEQGLAAMLKKLTQHKVKIFEFDEKEIGDVGSFEHSVFPAVKQIEKYFFN